MKLNREFELCPFCGYNAQIYEYETERRNGCMVYCVVCGSRGYGFSLYKKWAKKRAIRNWKRRNRIWNLIERG